MNVHSTTARESDISIRTDDQGRFACRVVNWVP
jgi:hypothetical protein